MSHRSGAHDSRALPSPRRTVATRLSIGEVAESIELSVRSIRYYEEVGLVVPVRTAGGHRSYTAADVARLSMIMKMKPLGFTLQEMGGLLTAWDEVRDGTRGGARDTLSMYRDLVEQRWARLQERLAIADDFRRQLAHQLGDDGPRGSRAGA